MAVSQGVVVRAKAPVRLAVEWVVAPMATVAGAMGTVGATARAMVVGVMGSAAVITCPAAETGSAKATVSVAGEEGEGRCPAHRPRLSRSW